jgi:formylglycine-generating enzyme required for sulfatase activity
MTTRVAKTVRRFGRVGLSSGAWQWVAGVGLLCLISGAQQSSTDARDPLVGTKAGQVWDGNGLKMKFCWCPPGKFTMGTPKGEVRSKVPKGEEQVKVTLSRGFWLGKYELTRGEWQQIMGTTLRQQIAKQLNQEKTKESIDEGASYPMSCVNYAEATEFCRKLTEQERKAGRLPADWEYRLPTEAQWEYACRAGTTTSTAFKLTRDTANYDWDWQPNGKSTGPPSRLKTVGSYPPNAWGLHDMHGNVSEWCRDWYGTPRHGPRPLPGGIDPEITDPGPAGGLPFRAVRGGNYGPMIATNQMRSAARGHAFARTRTLATGFRVALVQSVK